MNSFILASNFSNNLNDILCPIEFVNKGKKDKLSNVASVFDIEASSFYKNNIRKPENKRCCEYAWVFGINGKCIRGRTWEEFLNVLDKVIECYGITLSKRFVIYIHNFSYEFQWMKRLFNWAKVFSLEPHKPIYAITDKGIEFRCSYLLTGLSLAAVGEDLTRYKVKKMVGDLNYNLLRGPWTPLTEKEWGYILHDGLVVMAKIQEEIEKTGSIAEIPYTKTGYVRNLCRNNCLKGEGSFNFYKLVHNLTMTPEEYKELKRAFAGGFTHGNCHHINETCERVHSRDFTSSYPAVMLSEMFPMSQGIHVKIKDEKDFRDKLKKYCCLFDVKFTNIYAKVNFEHYISRSKCSLIEDYVLDNGRVVEAEVLQTTITEQDFDIIERMYEWDSMIIGNFVIYYKDYLPKSLVETTLKLYHDKTTLKGVAGKEEEYLASKGMINAEYGMSVMDPCKDEILYDNDADWHVEKDDLVKLIFLYNASRNRFLYYPWGIWITAYARRNLFSAILELKDDYIYSDTDSVKYRNDENHKEYFNLYNDMIKKKIKQCLNYRGLRYNLAEPKTIKGIKKPLGVWDYEGCYEKFKTLGAKRYMYYDGKDIHITISGVKKSNGVEYLKYKFKTIDNIFKNFKEDLEFPPEYIDNNVVKQGSGKLTHTYIDDYQSEYFIDYLGNKGSYSEYSGVHMEPAGYSMGLDEAFKNYLLGIKESYIL